MDNSLRQQESDTRLPVGFFAILHWLLSLIQLTEEEQEDAGIYLDGPFSN